MKRNQPVGQPYRVEILNWKEKWDLLGVKHSIGMAHFLARDYDDYFVRIVKCNRQRTEVWKNFESVQIPT